MDSHWHETEDGPREEFTTRDKCPHCTPVHIITPESEKPRPKRKPVVVPGAIPPLVS